MHGSALEAGQAFAERYCKRFTSEQVVVDVGSYDVNGTLKPFFSHCKYIGVDISEGPNVDIVTELGVIPVADNSADALISTSCFEHDEFFWETFIEMSRAVKPGGFIYINAPSRGPYHGYPGDCWRFYQDSWRALAKYAVKKGFAIRLLESGVNTATSDWGDSVGIFTKD